MHMWPIDLDLPDIGTSDRHIVLGQELCISRSSPTHVELRRGQEPPYNVGIQQSATTMRFIPHAGQLPLLNFLEPRLLCPARTSIQIVLAVDLYLQLGFGHAQDFALITELEAAQSSRALYGPVDAGTVCRSVHATHYNSMALAREAYDTGEETSEHEGATSHPTLQHAPTALLPVHIHNITQAPLDVSKIMIPLQAFGLFQLSDILYGGMLHMTLKGTQEAELEYKGVTHLKGATPIYDLDNNPMVPVEKTFLYVHNYRTKTGLDFGF